MSYKVMREHKRSQTLKKVVGLISCDILSDDFSKLDKIFNILDIK